MRNVYILVGKSKGKRPLESLQEDDIKMDLWPRIGTSGGLL
jgi:hypothetical protein